MQVVITGYTSLSISGNTVTISSEPEVPEELNPDPNFALGFEGWEALSNEGSIEPVSGGFMFTDCGAGDRLVPVDANAAAFNANLADNTTYTVRVTVTNYVSGAPSCTLKGGVTVALGDVGDGVFEGTVTAGDTLDPPKLRGSAMSDFTATVTSWSVK